MTSDFNAGTVSQATLQITESTAETFFVTCSSPFILAVTIKEVECSCIIFFIFLFSMKISCNSIMVWTDSVYANSKSPPITYVYSEVTLLLSFMTCDSWSSLADTSNMVYLHASPSYQHTMYSTGQLKYRWHQQRKSLSPAAVLCSSLHYCYSYWTCP